MSRRRCIPSDCSSLRLYACLARRVIRTMQPGWEAGVCSVIAVRLYHCPTRIMFPKMILEARMIHARLFSSRTQYLGRSSMSARATTRSQTLETPTREEAERRRERRRWIALAVLCLGQLMMVLDATIVNVALPAIQRDLHFSQGNLTWVMNGYLITFGGFLLLAGRLGDLVGRKRVFLGGLVLFTVASILCGIADSQGLLIGARLLQGV